MTGNPSPKFASMIVRLPPATHQKLKDLAERDDRSMAQLVRVAIRNYLNEVDPDEMSPKIMVQAQFDRILTLCDDVVTDGTTAAEICEQIIPGSRERVLLFSEARKIIATLEARKLEHH